MKKKVKVYEVGDILTPKQERWIDEYLKVNDLAIASKNAGYNGSNSILRAMGYQNSLKFKNIIEERRKELSEELRKETIADLDRIYTFWTDTMNDSDERMNDRLKASELLAKAQGAFVDRVEVKPIETDWFK